MEKKLNSSLFSKKYYSGYLEKEISIINQGIIEKDYYILDFLKEANHTYINDREYFYLLYDELEKSSNCGIYIMLTSILLKNNDEKANLKEADRKIEILIKKNYDVYYAKCNIIEYMGNINSVNLIKDDIIYEDDSRYELIKKFRSKKSASVYFCAIKPYKPYDIKKNPDIDDIIFIRKFLSFNYRMYYILLLSDHSELAKRLLNIIIKSKHYRSFIYIILIFKYGFNLSYKDGVDYLINSGANLIDIIISYIFFYSNNSKIPYYDSFAIQIKNSDFNNFFFDLIKDNYEDFENLFFNKEIINKITKNSSNFIPFFYEFCKRDVNSNYSRILCSLLDNKSKKIHRIAVKMINHKKKESYLYLKKLNNELAEDLLKKWKKDKLAKSGFKNLNEILNFIDRNYDKKLENHLLCIDDSLLYGVISKHNYENIPVIVIKYIYLEYSKLKKPAKINVLDKLISYFNFNTFINAAERTYDKWVLEGSDASCKYLMIPYLIYENGHKLSKVLLNIKEWCEAGRISLANYAISTLALNGSKCSLIIINYIYNNFKYAQIKNISLLSLKAAAKKLNLTDDELADKIIPNFGINNEGEIVISDDNYSFTVYIDEKMDIVKLIDNKTKKRVNKLEKYTHLNRSAIYHYNNVKNYIKPIAQFEVNRLNKALMTNKKWNAEKWNKIFTNNFIMNILAPLFIWTVYNQNNEIQKNVRYDRLKNIFYTLDNNEYEINNECKLSLASPIDMTEDDIIKSKNIIKDLKIEQPFNQMQNVNFSFNSDDITDNVIIKYRNRKVDVASFKNLINILNNMELDYYNSKIVGYKVIDTSIFVGVKINLMGINNEIEDNDSVLFGDVVFYTIDNTGIFSYKNIIDPSKSYLRYVNYIMFNLNNCIKI